MTGEPSKQFLLDEKLKAIATEQCTHENNWFDRTYCGCGSMHTYCDDCDIILGYCSLTPDAPDWRTQ